MCMLKFIKNVKEFLGLDEFTKLDKKKSIKKILKSLKEKKKEIDKKLENKLIKKEKRKLKEELKIISLLIKKGEKILNK